MATDTYVEKVVAELAVALIGAKLDANPTVMDGHPNTLLVEDPDTGTLYTVTVEEA